MLSVRGVDDPEQLLAASGVAGVAGAIAWWDELVASGAQVRPGLLVATIRRGGKPGFQAQPAASAAPVARTASMVLADRSKRRLAATVAWCEQNGLTLADGSADPFAVGAAVVLRWTKGDDEVTVQMVRERAARQRKLRGMEKT